MYSIVLTNGKIINIKATEVEWCETPRMIKLINNRTIVARINMDNIVGWVNADYKVENKEELDFIQPHKKIPCTITITESEE